MCLLLNADSKTCTVERWRAFLHTDCETAIAIANVLGIILFCIIMVLCLIAVKRRYVPPLLLHKTIMHALVTSKLDYGNAVLFGINGRLINKLQMTQNSAAHLIMRQRRRDHITPVLIALHWLPIRYRIISAGVDVSSSPQSSVRIHN